MNSRDIKQLLENHKSLFSMPDTVLKGAQIVAKGASANIYKIEWKGKAYAIKHCNYDSYHKPAFEQEIKNFRAFATFGYKIPNIIEYFGTFENGYDILLEYMPNGDLIDFLNKVKSPSWKWCHTASIRITEAVAALHESNYIHGDIKPDNVLLDADLNVKLADFGNAMTVEEAKMCEASGSLEWLAPELKENREIKHNTKASDVYSLGLVIWAIYIEGDTYNEGYKDIINLEKAHPRIENLPHLFKRTGNAVEGACQFDPDKRISATEMLQHLQPK